MSSTSSMSNPFYHRSRAGLIPALSNHVEVIYDEGFLESEESSQKYQTPDREKSDESYDDQDRFSFEDDYPRELSPWVRRSEDSYQSMVVGDEPLVFVPRKFQFEDQRFAQIYKDDQHDVFGPYLRNKRKYPSIKNMDEIRCKRHDSCIIND